MQECLLELCLVGAKLVMKPQNEYLVVRGPCTADLLPVAVTLFKCGALDGRFLKQCDVFIIRLQECYRNSSAKVGLHTSGPTRNTMDLIMTGMHRMTVGIGGTNEANVLRG